MAGRMPDPLPISALQHLIFCERQCALIHIEGLWAENRLTVEGNVLHRRAHGEAQGPRGGGRTETRGDTLIVRGLALECERLGLVGKADVVEFRGGPLPVTGIARVAAAPPLGGRSLNRREGWGRPFPVEYKRGRPKGHDADRVQLCAQALCLEEMLGLPEGGVPAGALYYGRIRRRVEVAFDTALRARTCEAVACLRQLINDGITPRAKREKKCDRCSLLNLCLPHVTGPGVSAARYLEAGLNAADKA